VCRGSSDFIELKKKGIRKMCVGLSAKVVRISDGTAVVDAVSSELLEDLEPGDYVMVHAGVAIAKITEEDDEETNQLMEELL
jgi:hydrogenase expression/formation protein HypC